MAKLIESYLDSTACRRQTLLMHFEGKKFTSQKFQPKENCCDNCQERIRRGRYKDNNEEDCDSLFDFTEDAELLLKTIKVFCNKKGLGKAILCLRGSKTCQAPNNAMHAELHGKGKHKSEAWWKALNRLLVWQGHVEQRYLQFESGNSKAFPIPILLVSGRGETFLSSLESKRVETSLILPLGQEFSKLMKDLRKSKQTSKEASPSKDIIPSSTLLSTDDNNGQNLLYHHLLRVRKDRAIEMDCAPFHLASNQALIDLSSCRPSSLISLKDGNIDGFTDVKVQRDGLFWITHIVNFCKENSLPTDVKAKSKPDSDQFDGVLLERLQPSHQQTYELFQKQEMSIDQIMSVRNLVRSTVMSHLTTAYGIGLPVDLPRAGVPDTIKDEIIKAIHSPPINSNVARLKPIKEACPDYITYEQIRFVISYLRRLHDTQQKSVASFSSSSKDEVAKPSSTSGPFSSELSGFTSSAKEFFSQKTVPSFFKKERIAFEFSSEDACDKLELALISDEVNQDSFSPIDINPLKEEMVSDPVLFDKNSGQPQVFENESVAFKTEYEEREALIAQEFDWNECFQDTDGLDDPLIVADTAQEVKKEPFESCRSTSQSDINQRLSGEGLFSKNSSEDFKFCHETSGSSGKEHYNELNCKANTSKIRRMPEWLTNPNAQAEVRKKMKKNSLFKV